MISTEQRQYILEYFGYDPYSETAILERAKNVEGYSLQRLIDDSPIDVKVTTNLNKGQIGNLIEANWFGIPNNSVQGPDFENAGIELKVIPLTEDKTKELVVKERTKITSINYNELINENWDNSHAKNKLNKILFIFFHYVTDRDDSKKVDFNSTKIIRTILWELKGNDLTIISKDWWNIQKKVIDGLAHELSESNSNVLAASRTGSGGKDKNGLPKDLVEQPNKKYEAKALKRAFSLKQSFTKQYWQEISKKKKFESIIDSLNLRPKDDFEDVLLQKLLSFEGERIQNIADKYSLKITSAKSAVPNIIRKVIGFKDIRAKIKEFEQSGIQIKTVPVRTEDNFPWEDTSFPAMKLQEFVDEEWKDSTLLTYIEKILFIPVYRDTSKASDTPISDRVLGKSFYWSPSSSELETIEKEWKMYREEVRNGKAKTHKVKTKKMTKEVTDLSKASQTEIIHMRPHGKDSRDKDIDHLGNSVVKQSFWLNKRFVQKLINNI